MSAVLASPTAVESGLHSVRDPGSVAGAFTCLPSALAMAVTLGGTKRPLARERLTLSFAAFT